MSDLCIYNVESGPGEGYLRRGAQFSGDAKYRYGLWRLWEGDLPSLGWVMLNPSTADENVLDPTLRRCESFSRREGYGGMVICNLYALRSTDPKNLLKTTDPEGDDNLNALQRLLPLDYVMGWGTFESKVPVLSTAKVFCTRGADGRHGFVLGRNKDSSPKHPLYIKGDAPLQRVTR